MSVIFADPFGSFERGFIRGQDQRMKVENFEQTRRMREYELYDKFVFSPQQQLAKEQRAFDRQVQLLNMRKSSARARSEAATAAERVDAGMYGFVPRGGGAAPAASGGAARSTGLAGLGSQGVAGRFVSEFGATPRRG